MPREHWATCDHCRGHRYVGSFSCMKCHGEGRILIIQTDDDLTLSQRAAKEMLIVLAAVAIVIFTGAAILHWYHVI